jgi:hypothetical protein
MLDLLRDAFENSMRPIKNCYLGDPAAVCRAAEAWPS